MFPPPLSPTSNRRLALLGVERLENLGHGFHFASGNDRENVPVKVDGTALVLGVRLHFAHGLQHPQALVANNELHTVQLAAAEPPEETHPTGFVLFHPLGSAQNYMVTIFIDCTTRMARSLHSQPSCGAGRCHLHRHTDTSCPTAGDSASPQCAYIFYPAYRDACQIHLYERFLHAALPPAVPL